MSNKKTAQWIRYQLQKGLSRRQLYDLLIKDGYDSAQAKEAINSIGAAEVSYQPELKSTKHPNTLLIVLSIIGIIVFVLISGGLYTFLKQYNNQKSEIVLETVNRTNDENLDQFQPGQVPKCPTSVIRSTIPTTPSGTPFWPVKSHGHEFVVDDTENAIA